MISYLGVVSLYPHGASKVTGDRDRAVISLSTLAWLMVQHQLGSVGSQLTEAPPCSYLDACAFGDHDLPHTVEAVEVWLWEAGGQDGASALCQVATTWHWKETRAGQRLLGSPLWCFHRSFSMCLPQGLGPWFSAWPPPGLAASFTSTSLRISEPPSCASLSPDPLGPPLSGSPVCCNSSLVDFSSSSQIPHPYPKSHHL